MRTRILVVAWGAAAVLVLGAVFAFLGSSVPTPHDFEMLSTADPVPAIAPGSPPAISAGAAAGLDGRWSVGDGSFAGYRVEAVAGQDAVWITGQSGDVSGTIEVRGTSVTAVTITVGIAALTSSLPARDDYIRNRVFQAPLFPTATFRTSVPAVFSPPAVARRQAISAAGVLTAHGVSRGVVAEFEVVVGSPRLQVTGSIPVTFADYGLERPTGGKLAVANSGFFDFRLVLAGPHR
ncbi:MAG: polyisoprenoid-binding protein [Glaciihabitans sp.]|nr:polyisoprenoid-binding protein [Glaciihabitans sp.]